jgi:deoxyribodipyrimidine photo-lyase
MKTVDSSGGIGAWLRVLAFRDFYTTIVAHFPRVSMGRPYTEKYEKVVCEVPQVSAFGRSDSEDDAEAVNRWKAGKTGVPIVDAAMRCINEIGWAHNRARVLAAMYLTKHLMVDWRVGERVSYSTQGYSP